jgi:hypothetical protein
MTRNRLLVFCPIASRPAALASSFTGFQAIGPMRSGLYGKDPGGDVFISLGTTRMFIYVM